MPPARYRSVCHNAKLITPEPEVVVCSSCGNVCNQIKEYWEQRGTSQILSADLLPNLLIDEDRYEAEREQEKQARLRWSKGNI